MGLIASNGLKCHKSAFFGPVCTHVSHRSIPSQWALQVGEELRAHALPLLPGSPPACSFTLGFGVLLGFT